MVSASFTILGAYPLTARGKLGRHAVPISDVHAGAGQCIASHNAIEKNIAEMWMDLLAVGRVAVHDNFFDFGGNSLLALQPIGQIRQLNVDIDREAVFLTQTMEALSAGSETQLLAELDKMSAFEAASYLSGGAQL